MKATNEHRPDKPDPTELHPRYGRIGIAAVAAAVRFQDRSDDEEASALTLGDLDRKGLAA